MTVDELRAALDAAGVAYSSSDRKADLEALHAAHVADGTVPTVSGTVPSAPTGRISVLRRLRRED